MTFYGAHELKSGKESLQFQVFQVSLLSKAEFIPLVEQLGAVCLTCDDEEEEDQ